MPRLHSDYEEQHIDEDVGTAFITVGHSTDHYAVRLSGKEFTGGHYEAKTLSTIPLVYYGEIRGIHGELYAVVPLYHGNLDPESSRRVVVGDDRAHFYVEDR